MLLMNTNTPVLWIDKEDLTFEVLNNNMLPYSLKDYIKNLDFNDKNSFRLWRIYSDAIRNFFIDRTLSLSRDNAKVILNCIANTQKLTPDEKYKLSLSCRGVSIKDNFWVKEDDEQLLFSDINIRNKSLSNIVLNIALDGHHVSIQKDLLTPEIVTAGMFRKAWIRENGKLILVKSDKTKDFLNTKAEVEVSNMLDKSNIEHVKYNLSTYNKNTLCCKCECITTDDISLVDADYIKMWCDHNNIDFIKYIKKNHKSDFANMVVVDYLFGNTDRHICNWGFLIDNKNNEIIKIAPLMDHNQALICFLTNTKLDDLIYEPTGKSFSDSIKEWAPYSNIKFEEKLPNFFENRFTDIKNLIHEYKKDENEVFL